MADAPAKSSASTRSGYSGPHPHEIRADLLRESVNEIYIKFKSGEKPSQVAARTKISELFINHTDMLKEFPTDLAIPNVYVEDTRFFMEIFRLRFLNMALRERGRKIIEKFGRQIDIESFAWPIYCSPDGVLYEHKNWDGKHSKYAVNKYETKLRRTPEFVFVGELPLEMRAFVKHHGLVGNIEANAETSERDSKKASLQNTLKRHSEDAATTGNEVDEERKKKKTEEEPASSNSGEKVLEDAKKEVVKKGREKVVEDANYLVTIKIKDIQETSPIVLGGLGDDDFDVFTSEDFLEFWNQEAVKNPNQELSIVRLLAIFKFQTGNVMKE